MHSVDDGNSEPLVPKSPRVPQSPRSSNSILSRIGHLKKVLGTLLGAAVIAGCGHIPGERIEQPIRIGTGDICADGPDATEAAYAAALDEIHRFCREGYYLCVPGSEDVQITREPNENGVACAAASMGIAGKKDKQGDPEAGLI